MDMVRWYGYSVMIWIWCDDMDMVWWYGYGVMFSNYYTSILHQCNSYSFSNCNKKWLNHFHGDDFIYSIRLFQLASITIYDVVGINGAYFLDFLEAKFNSLAPGTTPLCGWRKTMQHWGNILLPNVMVILKHSLQNR